MTKLPKPDHLAALTKLDTPQVIAIPNVCRMLLLRCSATVLRKSPLALARNDRALGVALSQPLCSRLQAASMVSVSWFKMERDPRASTRVLFDLPREASVDQKLQHISFGFWEDDEPADVAWTFTISDGEDLIDVLERYASSMTDSTGDEYAGAFRRFVTKIAVQRLHLDQKSTAQKNAGSEKDVMVPEKGARRRSKTSDVPAKRVAGRARDEEFEQRFRQGESFLDLASAFERTPPFIFREAKRLFGEAELKELMKRKKRGKWSNDETQRLILLRKQSLPIPKITMWLRRTKSSVNKQLREVGSMMFESVLVEGPQELPPQLLESAFNTRLVNIWQGLLESEMTSTWREALSKKSAEEWLFPISQGIAKGVKRILGGLQPPTYEELESLPSVDSTDAGVYARLVRSCYELQTASDRYMYVGSASRYGSGLNGRVSEHIEKKRRRHFESRLQRDIRTKYLEGPGRFITLMNMQMNSLEKEDVLNVRRTVTLAEAILTVWLGALQSPSHHLQSLCQWDPQILDYTAWSSHNPLTKDVVEPNS